jgi:hypothetical protein
MCCAVLICTPLSAPPQTTQQLAMQKGYTALVSMLFDSVRAMSVRAGAASPFPLSPLLLKWQELGFWAEHDPSIAVQKAEELVREVGTGLMGSGPVQLRAVAFAKKLIADGTSPPPLSLFVVW